MIKSYKIEWFKVNKTKYEKILATGSAGFIGYSLCLKLLERGDFVVGVDNHND